MIIKRARTEQEIKQAFQVRTTVFVDEQHVPPEEEIDHFDKEAIHFIGIQDNHAIAASRLRFTEDYGKLERICVMKDARGKSYGSELIRKMETEIMENGYQKAKLNAQTHAEKFYKRLGYETISGEFLDAGIPHVTMIKNLE
ncbi:GNAT family N-acetyltransferase [Lentibacillus sp. L22]|uniref:GNAT family N-acetyltransferase n=1 Tax=Lentibacillus TaxID=175304 RepID=UPI0022B1D337|nr:GNAT family N-acetyltransferase [Lentibacillus daqui]